MARTITIIEHDDGKCHVFESYSRSGASMGGADSLAEALVQRPGLSGDVRLAILYQAVRSARRVGFTTEQVNAEVLRALIGADEEDRLSGEVLSKEST